MPEPPELPEVEAVALDLRGRLDGHAIAKINVAASRCARLAGDHPHHLPEGSHR